MPRRLSIRGTRTGEEPAWVLRVPARARRILGEGDAGVARSSALYLYALFAPLALLVEIGFGGAAAHPGMLAAACLLLALQAAGVGLVRDPGGRGWIAAVAAIAVTYVLLGRISHAAGSTLAILLVVPVGWVAVFRTGRDLAATVVMCAVATLSVAGGTASVSAGESVIVWLVRVLVYATTGVAIHLLVASLRRSRNAALRRANTDAVTGAASRSHMLDLLRTACAGGAGRPAAIVLVDVDHFKRVNDVHGHEAGDEALHALVGRLGLMLRSQDVLARWGGEEFLILVDGVETASDLAALAERIRGAVERAPFSVCGSRLDLTVSAGAALVPRSGCPVRVLVAAADAALYEAKHAGRNTSRVSGPPVADRTATAV